jgi:hypothetical protein
VFLEELAEGRKPLNLAQVLANLTESVLLLLVGLLELGQFDRWILGQSLVGQPIDRAIAVPPLNLPKPLSLDLGHVTLYLLNVTNGLVCHLPVTCELVTVRRPSGCRGFISLHQGLAIHHQGNLLTRWGESLHQEEGHVFSTDR